MATGDRETDGQIQIREQARLHVCEVECVAHSQLTTKDRRETREWAGELHT